MRLTKIRLRDWYKKHKDNIDLLLVIFLSSSITLFIKGIIDANG